MIKCINIQILARPGPSGEDEPFQKKTHCCFFFVHVSFIFTKLMIRYAKCVDFFHNLCIIPRICAVSLVSIDLEQYKFSFIHAFLLCFTN